MEPHKREIVREVTRRLAKAGRLLPVRQVMTMDIRGSGNAELVQTFYVEAASLVGFLIMEYNASRFSEFCRQLRDGKNVEDALRFAYPMAIRNVDDLEEKWRKFIMEEGS